MECDTMQSANGTWGLIHIVDLCCRDDSSTIGNVIEKYNRSFYMDGKEIDVLFEKIKKSLEYGALDHKWLVRDYLHNMKQEIDESTRSEGPRKKALATTVTDEEYTRQILYAMATSAFDYYNNHYSVFQSDQSLKAITNMCSTDEHSINVDKHDSDVYHLSNVFNEIIESTRELHRCYDCGTNARAIFLKLIETHRGVGHVDHQEQQRMKDEYLVKKKHVLEEIEKCHRKMAEVRSDTAFIMSLAIQTFGHVWVIEKRFLSGRPRYHHYQTSLRSHLLLDFIESKDYGRDLQQSLDIDRFFGDLSYLLTNNKAWEDDDYRLFAKMFAFLPVSEVTTPDPGFSYTWITY